MENEMLIETTKDWVVVRIPRRLIRAKKRVVLTATKALKIFQKGREEYQAGKLSPVSSLSGIV